MKFVQPMGENKINSMMKNIMSETTLESSEKRFSNHSARKTLVSKMKKANLERSSIAKVTGHRNIQSLDDYDMKQTNTKSDSFRESSQKEIAQQNPCQWPVVHPVLLLQMQQFLTWWAHKRGIWWIPSLTTLSHSTSTARPRPSLNLSNDDCISSKVIWIWCWQFLKLLSCTLNFTLRKLLLWSKAESGC